MSIAMHVCATRGAGEGYVIPLTPNRAFYQVGGKFLERMSVVIEIFNRVLQPLYGSQEKALQQIAESKDRRCFLLYEETVPVGVLVFKTVLSDEFQEFGVTASIEIKSLFVDQSTQNSGRGLGSALLEQLHQEIPKLGLAHKGIHVTVSETKHDSLTFFRKKQFQIVHEWKGRYKEGVTEYLLSCPATIVRIEEKKMADSEAAAQKLSPRQITHSVSQGHNLICIVKDAHLDDIHALKKLSDGTFVSASKDNCLYKWNRNGERVKVIDEVEPTQKDDRDWVTAVQVLNDEYWVSGERNGRISLWKTNGAYVRDIQTKLPKQGTHVSHAHNAQRINCFANGLNVHKPSLLIGLPTMFDEFNFMEGRTEFSTKVHNNDWVYAMNPLREDKILVVTGCDVDVWNKANNKWQRGEKLVSEGLKSRVRKGQPKPQRPFISSLVPLDDSKNQFGLSVFDGSVKVLDVAKKTIVRQWKEHEGRVWAIESITPQLFASSGEDRTVKLWDLRSRASVYTIGDHVGQVTSILSFDQHTLIAGTCPENAFSNKQGAELRFYDIRR